MNSEESNIARIAIIVTHGVGDQKPYKSAESVADLLLKFGQGTITSFKKTQLKIPVSKLEITQQIPEKSKSDKGGFLKRFDQRTPSIKAWHKNNSPHPYPEHEYMRDQLSDYEITNTEKIYDTIRFECNSNSLGTSSHETHIYEMYWDDLSRPGSSLYRLLIELYQILFQVCILGRHSLDFAICNNSNKPTTWKILYFFHGLAETLIALVIPILNLSGLAIVAMLLPIWLFPSGYNSLIFPCAWIAWTVSTLAIIWLMRSYEKWHPGAFPIIIITVIFVLFIFSILTINKNEAEQSALIDYALRVFEITRFPISISWLFIFISIIALTVVGWFAVLCSSDSESAKHTVWTANLSILIPCILVVILNLVLWEMIAKTIQNNLDPILLKQTHHTVVSFDFTGILYKNTTAFSAFETIIQESTEVFLRAVMLFIIPTLLSMTLLFPAILWEIKPGRPYESTETKKLGNSLSSALKSIRIIWEAVRWFVIVTTLLIFKNNIPQSSQLGYEIQVILASGVATFGWLLRKPLYIIVGISLDVINHLRIHPLKSNPRARIAARYFSLLKFLQNWKNKNGHGYDACIIIAHSQGTVITADFLRFLKNEQKKAHHTNHNSIFSKSKPIYFFSVGCPLRQLYNARFPYQYAWVTNNKITDLGVKLWVNAYRSGDYVGRQLFVPDETAWMIDKSTPYKTNLFEEFCIGPGAHTHYLDDFGKDIASKLFNIISEVTNSKSWQQHAEDQI